MLPRLAACAFLLLSACASTPAAPTQDRPAGFVDAATVIPGLVVDMRYAGSDNFIGRPITGYDAPVCLLTREAAAALAKVQAQLADFGLGLKMYDCYRPARAVADFVAWARDPADQKQKADHYPNVDKSQLFALGYIAERSGHSRGSTFDLTVVDLVSGAELDMGSAYDLFDTRSWPTDRTIAPDARGNRLMLHAIMIANGFKPLKEEWWHFTLANEPWPNTWFDFPITGQAAR